MNLSNASILFLTIILPISLVFGPALPDIIVSIVGINFLILMFYKKNFLIFKNKYFIFFLFYCLYLILLSLFSKNPFLSLESSLFYFRFGVFVLAIIYVSDKFYKFNYFFLLSLLATCLLVSADVILEFLKFDFRPSYFLYENNKLNNNRFSGLFGDEYKLGSFLVRLLPLICGLYFFKFTNDPKKIYSLLLFILIVSLSIIISGERLAIGYLIIFFLFLIIFISFFRKIILTTIIILSILISSLIYYNDNIRDRVLSYTIFQSNILGEDIFLFSVQHQLIFSTAFKIFIDNKIFGIGPKMFREICKDEKYHSFSDLDRSHNGCQAHPHNTFIQLLTETGFIGFFMALMMYIFILFKLFQILKLKKIQLDKNDYLNFFIYLSIIINLFPFAPNGNFFNNWLSILIILPLGFIKFKH